MNMIFIQTYADMMEKTKADFYVIERFPDPCFVTDFEGNVKCFEKYSDALAKANECQDGHVIIFPS
ncbi:MAG: hypothetical protein ABI581_10425 [Sediminibacterium sp.]